MESRKKHMTLQKHKLVIFHYPQGKSQREISKILYKSRNIIEYIIKRYNEDNRISNKTKEARKTS